MVIIFRYPKLNNLFLNWKLMYCGHVMSKTKIVHSKTKTTVNKSMQKFQQYCFWWKGWFVSVYFKVGDRDMHCDCFSSPSLISNPGMVSTIRFHKYNMELGMSDNMLGLKELFIDCSEIGSKRDKKTMIWIFYLFLDLWCIPTDWVNLFIF